MIDKMVLKSLLGEACSRSNIPSEYRKIAIHTDWLDSEWRISISWPICVEGEVETTSVWAVFDQKDKGLWDINVLIDLLKSAAAEEND